MAPPKWGVADLLARGFHPVETKAALECFPSGEDWSMMRARILPILLAPATCLMACMTFNGAELPGRQLPEHDWFQPLISTEVGEIRLLHNGKESSLKPAMTAHGIGDTVLTTVLLRWKAEKLIKDYGKPGELEQEPDYQLII